MNEQEVNEIAEQPAVYTVAGFCEAYQISKPTYYRMVRDGRAPQSIRLGHTVRIPYSAAKAWEDKYLGDTVIPLEMSKDRSKRARGG